MSNRPPTKPGDSLKVGDQVKVIARSHPWFDAIGCIAERFHSTSPDHWVVETGDDPAGPPCNGP